MIFFLHETCLELEELDRNVLQVVVVLTFDILDDRLLEGDLLLELHYLLGGDCTKQYSKQTQLSEEIILLFSRGKISILE